MSRRYAAKGIRERIHTVRLDEAYRLIRRRHQDRPLGTIPTSSRFSDPLGRYSVLYATQSMQCAVWEGLARDRFARRRRRILAFREAEPVVVVTLHTIEPLSLVDLRHDGPVRIGAPTAVTHDADHRGGAVAVSGHLRERARSRRLCVPIEIHRAHVHGRIRQSDRQARGPRRDRAGTTPEVCRCTDRLRHHAAQHREVSEQRRKPGRLVTDQARSGQEDLSTAQATGPSGSLSTAQVTRPSGRFARATTGKRLRASICVRYSSASTGKVVEALIDGDRQRVEQALVSDSSAEPTSDRSDRAGTWFVPLGDDTGP